ncbi:MAG: glutamate--tRNA ligase, partial [Chloroflexi bacterium]|nr:glutamate--tRNA ligase [Chloroflexota bacterium]
VRFAPSPTGYLHVGGARSCLFNWLFARRHGGTFILRIEDTDRTRYYERSLTDLLEGLRWLGLHWDEGPEVGGPHDPYFQSQRLPLYQRYAQELIESGHAYKCYCSPKRLQQMREEQRQRGQSPGYDRHCRELSARERSERERQGIVPVIRLQVPLDGEISFHDLIRGTIAMQNSQMDDFVLLKSDGFPTYHLANVVDDHLMDISHIMRADEWIPSTPRHALMYKAFGWTPPLYAHLPVILSPTGQGKMSKRKTTSPDGRTYNVLVREFRAAGYLPEALFNFLALVGWSYDGHTEILTREQMVENFGLGHISPSPARFSYDKLDWMNGQYIRTLGAEELATRLQPVFAQAGLEVDAETLRHIAPLIQERIVTLADAVRWTDFFFVDELQYDPQSLVQPKMTVEQARQVLAESHRALQALPAFEEEAIDHALRAEAEKMGLKARQFLGTLRVAVTGKEVAPPLFGTLAILGREKTLKRIAHARALLASA